MPRMFMAVRQEDRHPIVEILRQTPEIPENCQWAMFLRNHDELTLEMVTDEERDYMYQAYAADPQMRINVGIRRRLAPLMENSRRRIELMNGLLFSHAGHAGHLLRRRDRHGRQHLPRRSQRRPHADAVDRRSQRRLLARRSGAAVRAADHGSGLRLPGDQRRGAGALAVLAPELDEADDRPAQAAHRCSAAAAIEFLPPQNRKVLAYVRSTRTRRSSASPTCRARVQPVELDLVAFQGHDAGRDARPHRVPAHRRAARTSSRSARTRSTGSACSNGAGADHGARGARDRRRGPAGARRCFVGAAWDTLLDGNVRTLIERDLLVPLPAATALVRRQGARRCARRASSTGGCCAAARSRCS